MNTTRLVRLSALVALAIVLSIVESTLSPVMPVPGMKLGLANIVVMYTFLAFEKRSALVVTISKSLFVLSTRGVISCLLSLSGGLASLIFLFLVHCFTNGTLSLLLLSIIGALVHNLTQILVVTLLYNHFIAYFYIPLLIVAGVIAGTATAMLLHLTRPVLSKIDQSYHRGDKL